MKNLRITSHLGWVIGLGGLGLLNPFWTYETKAAVPKKTDVVVIGAGLSGLATGHLLKKNKIDFHILELTPRVGGRTRTVTYELPGEVPTYSDSGTEEYWESNPAVKLIEELGLPHSKDVAVSSIKIEGKIYPLGKAETSSEFLQTIFSPKEWEAFKKFKLAVAPRVRMLKGLRDGRGALTAEDRKLMNVSFGAWVEKQVPKKVAEWIRISIECEIGTSWNRISALDGLDEFHIFLGETGEGEKCYRVEGGNQKFTEALADSIGRKHLSLNQRVQRVETLKEGVRVSVLDQETNKLRVIEAKYVVSTVPLYRLFEIQFVPGLSEKKKQAIQTQTWGSYFKAHVLVSKEAERHWQDKNQESQLPILSDGPLGVIYEGNPEQKSGLKIISLLITGDHAEAFTMMQQQDVQSKIESELDRLWPGIVKKIRAIEFYRYHPRAIAAWPVGRSRFDDLSQEIRREENRIFLGGDFTETSHSDGAFISADRITKRVVHLLKGE